jgi:hypothetical protein
MRKTRKTKTDDDAGRVVKLINRIHKDQYMLKQLIKKIAKESVLVSIDEVIPK